LFYFPLQVVSHGNSFLLFWIRFAIPVSVARSSADVCETLSRFLDGILHPSPPAFLPDAVMLMVAFHLYNTFF